MLVAEHTNAASDTLQQNADSTADEPNGYTQLSTEELSPDEPNGLSSDGLLSE